MSDLVITGPGLPSTSQDVAFANAVEAMAKEQPQVDIDTTHNFHAGMYARTICVPAGCLITGTEIKKDTILIVSGDCLIFGGPVGACRFTGYHVLHGMSGRKNVFHAITDTWLTMIFPTDAQDVDSAEREFTDEFEKLGSRRVKQ